MDLLVNGYPDRPLRGYTHRASGIIFYTYVPRKDQACTLFIFP